MWVWVDGCLTSHSRACSRAGGPCSNRSRWARSNTRRTWHRSRARSARSRAVGSGRRWETRSPRTTPPLPCTPDLEGAHQFVDKKTEAGQKPGYGTLSSSLPRETSPKKVDSPQTSPGWVQALGKPWHCGQLTFKSERPQSSPRSPPPKNKPYP